MITIKEIVSVTRNDPLVDVYKSQLTGGNGWVIREDTTQVTFENTQFIGAKTDARPVFLYGDGYADGSMVYDTAECPNCGYTLDDDFDFDKPHEPYCPRCGQLLDWNVREDER